MGISHLLHGSLTLTAVKRQNLERKLLEGGGGGGKGRGGEEGRRPTVQNGDATHNSDCIMHFQVHSTAQRQKMNTRGKQRHKLISTKKE
jgi:hypothetical protein